MKKLLIIGYYELKEHMLHIRKLFSDYDYDVTNFPLLRFAYDINDKVKNYEELLDQYIKKINPDIILWWFVDVPVKVFKNIKTVNEDILFIMFNGDDPLNFNI